MVIIKCDNAGLWCNINRERARENGNIIFCVFQIFFSFFTGFKILIVRFVEFICWPGECEEVIVVFVAEAEASLTRTRGQ